MTNHDLPMTPIDSPSELGYSSGMIRRRIAPAIKTGNQVYYLSLGASVSNIDPF